MRSGAPDPAVLRLSPAMAPEARYQALVEILPDVLISLFDRDPRILAPEGGALSRLPMGAEAVIGRYLHELLPEDLLAFSRAGSVTTEPEEVALQPLVEGIFQTLIANREGDGATLVAGGLPTIVGDRRQLGQLFQNLLGNGLKFVRPGEPTVLEIRAQPLPDGGARFRFDLPAAERSP